MLSPQILVVISLVVHDVVCQFVREETRSNRRHCSPPTGSVDGSIVVEDSEGVMANLTTITWKIPLGSTLCYRFKSDTSTLEGMVEVTYMSLKTIYSIMDSYKFPLVSSSVSCLCDCPGGASQCDSHTNLCGNKTQCVPYYNPSVQSQGCFLHFLQLSATLCCQIQAQPSSQGLFRAIRLGVPSVLAQFETVLRDNTGEVVDSRIFNIDLNSGAAIDWYLSLQVSTPGPTTLAPPGWYVVPGTTSHRNSLLTALNVNGLDEWDINKLGWLKAGKMNRFVTSSLEQLSQQFLPSVQSCAEGKYSGYFARGEIDKQDIGGREVTAEYPFLADVHVWRRHVEMEHKESPLLAMTLQHRTKVGVTVQYSTSHLADFTGVLYQDTASHTHLNLSLYGAAGTINGIISSYNYSQSFRLRLSQHPSNLTQHIKLTATECLGNEVTVSLRPLSPKNQTISKKIPCLYENMRSFRSSVGNTNNVGSVKGSIPDCLSCGSSWLHWLDPEHWMETVWPQTRVVILVTMVSMFIILIVILWKVAISVYQCFVSSRKGKQKKIIGDIILKEIEKVSDMRAVKEHEVQEERNMR